ncbi:hypothetical protein RQP46_011148 [Phenoliferia psychrophenolica]
MATFSYLAPELLLHILKLSNEGEPAKERQRSRLAFGLVSRAFFLATADTTEFCIEGEPQSKAFVAQLEKEKKWAAQEERKARSGSGRTSRSALTRVTRVTNIRRLFLTFDKRYIQKAFVDLLYATPNLVALELDFTSSRAGPIEISSQLAVAVGGLVGLQELRIHAEDLDPSILLQCLIPLKALEVLDLDVSDLLGYGYDDDIPYHTNDLSLPNVRELAIHLEGKDNFPCALFSALLAKSTNGVQVLDLKSSTPEDPFSFQMIESLLPHLAKVVDLTWGAPLPGSGAISNDAQDAVLKLIGGMTGLKSISMPTWPTETSWIPNVPAENQPIDHTLLDTLATLPSLETVRLIAKAGLLSSDYVITYMDSHPSLQSLSIDILQDGWMREQRDAVEQAANRADVKFSRSRVTTWGSKDSW